MQDSWHLSRHIKVADVMGVAMVDSSYQSNTFCQASLLGSSGLVDRVSGQPVMLAVQLLKLAGTKLEKAESGKRSVGSEKVLA